jgi:hypothetical protein
VNEVYEALQAKEKMKQMVSSEGSASEALSLRGRTQHKSNDGYRGKSSNGYRGRSKSRGKGENYAGTTKRTLILFLSVIN